MTFNEKFNDIINDSYKAIDSAFLIPIKEFVQSWQQFRLRDSKLAYLVIGILFVFTLLSFLVSYKILTNNLSPVANNYSQQPTYNPQSRIGGSEADNDLQGEKRAKVAYLNFFNSLTGFFGDYFGQYVFQTVDPTGLSTIVPSGVSFYPVVNSDTKLQMGSGSFLFTTIRYSNVLLAIVAPIMAVLITMTGLQIIMNSNNSSQYGELSDRIKRLIFCGAMVFVITPTLLSFSVMSTQLLNNQILTLIGTQNTPECKDKPKSDTECIFGGITKQLILKSNPSIAQSNSEAVDQKAGEIEIPSWDIGGIIMYQARTGGGLVKLIPVIILTLIILILFLVILIQFILRYLNLYFLFIIYPIVAVFWFNQSTSKFYSQYWQQIITLLIQQPVFLICFAIFVDMTIGISTNLTSLPNLLVYAVFLGFMTVVPPTLSARIFGDAFAMADHLGFAQSKNFIGQKIDQAKSNTLNMTPNRIQNSPRFPLIAAQKPVKNVNTTTNKLDSKSKNSSIDLNSAPQSSPSNVQNATNIDLNKNQINLKQNLNTNLNTPDSDPKPNNSKYKPISLKPKQIATPNNQLPIQKV